MTHLPVVGLQIAAAAAAMLLESCPTLCDPIDGSPPGSSSMRSMEVRISITVCPAEIKSVAGAEKEVRKP